MNIVGSVLQMTLRVFSVLWHQVTSASKLLLYSMSIRKENPKYSMYVCTCNRPSEGSFGCDSGVLVCHFYVCTHTILDHRAINLTYTRVPDCTLIHATGGTQLDSVSSSHTN